MRNSVFAELQFWLLVIFSLVLPVAILWVLLVKRVVSRSTVLLLGVALVAIAAVDLYLLQLLATMAKETPSLADDAIFASELTIALYVLPALFAGVGVNIFSHMLMRHLEQAEAAFDRQRPDA